MELNSSKNKYTISIDSSKIVNAVNKYNWVKRNSKKYSFGYVEESKIDDYYYIYIAKFSDFQKKDIIEVYNSKITERRV